MKTTAKKLKRSIGLSIAVIMAISSISVADDGNSDQKHGAEHGYFNWWIKNVKGSIVNLTLIEAIKNGVVLPKEVVGEAFGGEKPDDVVAEDGVGVVLLDVVDSSTDNKANKKRTFSYWRDLQWLKYKYLDDYRAHRQDGENIWDFLARYLKGEDAEMFEEASAVLGDLLTIFSPPPDNTCENGFYGNQQVINCNMAGIRYLRRGWRELHSVDNLDLSGTDITSLGNLAGLNYFKYLKINNQKVSDLSGLSNVTGIGGDFVLDGNPFIFDLDFLQNLSFVQGELSLKGMPKLANVDGLSNVTKIGKLEIESPNLTSFSGLSHISSISNAVVINTDTKKLKSIKKMNGASPICAGNYLDSKVYVNGVSLAQDPSLKDKICGEFIDDGKIQPLENCLTGYRGWKSYINCSNKALEILSSGWRHLNGVYGELRLDGNNFTNIDNLENLVYLSVGHFEKNPNLRSVRGLRNVHGREEYFPYAGRYGHGYRARIYLDKRYYSQKLPLSSPICGAPGMIHEVRLWNGEEYENIDPRKKYDYICDANDLSVDTASHNIANCEIGGGYYKFTYEGVDCYSMGMRELREGWLGLTKTEGNLYFYDNDFTNLDNLSNLTYIKGDLYLNVDKLTDYSGLSNLRHVGRDIYFSHAKHLTDLSFLRSLTVADRIYANDGVLQRVGDLGSISKVRVGWGLWLHDNPYLTDIEGIKNVRRYYPNPDYIPKLFLDKRNYTKKIPATSKYCADKKWLDHVLFRIDSKDAHVDPSEKYDTICERLQDDGNVQPNNDCETGYSGFQYIVHCDNMGLERLSSGWNHLNNLVELHIENNRITALDNLKGLTGVGQLLYDSEKITDFSGLSNLLGIGSFYITDNPYIKNLDFLSNLTNIRDWILIKNNQNLENITALSNGIAGGELYEITIEDNPNLTDLSGIVPEPKRDNRTVYYHIKNNNVLDNTGNAVFNNAASVEIKNNTKLSNLNFLIGTKYLYGEITANDSLTNIAGLQNVTTIGRKLTLDKKNYDVKIPGWGKICSTQELHDVYFGNVQIDPNEKYETICQKVVDNGNLVPRNDCETGYSGERGSINCSDLGLYTVSSGWNNLKKVNILDFRDNRITKIENLNSLTSAAEIYFDKDKVTEITGLSSIKYLGGLDIGGMTVIKNLDFLSSLTDISKLEASGADLHNLDGLSNVVRVSRNSNADCGYLNFSGNPNLTSISGLSKITHLYKNIFLDKKEYDGKIEGTSPLCAVPSMFNRVILDGSRPSKNDRYLICTEFEDDGNVEANNDCITGYAGEVSDIYCADLGLKKLSSGWRNLNKVEGTIDLRGNVFTDMAYLTGLTYVGSTFYFPRALTSLFGLDNLSYMGNLKITNMDQITSIDHLTNLERAGYITIANNQNLRTLNGLGKEKGLSVSTKINIFDNPSLTDISALQNITKLRYTYNDVLYMERKAYDIKIPWNSFLCSTKEGFTQMRLRDYISSNVDDRYAEKRSVLCENIPENIPAQNDCVSGFSGEIDTDIYCNSLGMSYLADGWRELRRVNYLNLYGNKLSSIDNLSGLTKFGTIYFTSQYLSNIHGLLNVTDFGSLTIVDNGILKDLTGLDSVTRFNNLYMTNMQGLTSLKGLGSVNYFTNFYINNAPNLTSIDYLSSVTEFQKLDLSYTGIKNLDGLLSVKKFEKLNIGGSPNLTSVRGLANVTAIPDYIYYYYDSDINNFSVKMPWNSYLCRKGEDVELIKGGSSTYTLAYYRSKFCDPIPDHENVSPDNDCVTGFDGSFEKIDCGRSYIDKMTSGWNHLTGVQTYLLLPTSLKEVKNLSSLTYVGKLSVPNGVTAVSGLGSLTSVIELSLPSSVQSIDISSLRTVHKLHSSAKVDNLQFLSKITSVHYIPGILYGNGSIYLKIKYPNSDVNYEYDYISFSYASEIGAIHNSYKIIAKISSPSSSVWKYLFRIRFWYNWGYHYYGLTASNYTSYSNVYSKPLINIENMRNLTDISALDSFSPVLPYPEGQAPFFARNSDEYRTWEIIDSENKANAAPPAKYINDYISSIDINYPVFRFPNKDFSVKLSADSWICRKGYASIMVGGKFITSGENSSDQMKSLYDKICKTFDGYNMDNPQNDCFTGYSGNARRALCIGGFIQDMSAGWNRLNSIGSLIFTKTSISAIDQLSGLTQVGYMEVSGNDNLTKVDIPNVTAAIFVKILNNKSLSELSGLNSLAVVGEGLRLDRNNLTTIPDFNNLTAVGNDLSLDGNNLTDISEFNNLTAVGGYLELHNNNLTDVSGFNNLTAIGYDLYLQNNNLTSISGFKTLRYVESVDIRDNPNLTDLSWLNNVTIRWRLYINGNCSRFTKKINRYSYICQHSSVISGCSRSSICE